VTDLNREYLRKLTEIPTIAVERFNEEIENIRTHRKRGTASATQPRRRAARAKT